VDLLALPSFPTRRSSDLTHMADQLNDTLVARDSSDQEHGPYRSHTVSRPTKLERRRGSKWTVRLIVLAAIGAAAVLAPRALKKKDRKSTRLNSSHVAISY